MSTSGPPGALPAAPRGTPRGSDPSGAAGRPDPLEAGARPTPAPRPRRCSRPWWAGVLPVPTVRSAGLLGLAAAGVLLLPGPWALVAPAVAVALIVLDARLPPAPWRVGVARELPAVLGLDREGVVTWRVANPARRPLTVALADELVPSLGAGSRRVRLTVPTGGTARASVALRPRRRGTFRPAEVTVRVTGPLGLATRQASRRLPGRLQVHPSFRSRQAAELRLRRARLLEQGLRSVRGRGGGTEFEALRDYVEGDEVRHVDWAATARMGRPIVRTHRAERNQRVLVLLDTGRVTAGLVEGVPRLDHGMDATLALATVATRSGDRVGLLAFGSRVHALVPPRGDAAQLRRLSTAMHALEPELAESAYRDAFVTALARVRRRALLVVVTELAAEAVQATLLPALGLVLRDHAVVVVSVQDPVVGAWALRGGQGAAEAYRAAASVGLLEERRRAASHLRALGARVVDAPPARLAGRLTDAYLDLKASGSL